MIVPGVDKNKEILEAIQNGQNEKILNYLYKTSLPQIIAFISRNNGDEDEAKDIFQDAVVALITTVKLGKYIEGKDVNGFLYFVSRNLWVNRIKKRNKQFDINDLEFTPEADSPLAVIITEDKKNAIDLVLDRLGSRCKQILKHVIYDDLSMKEIAAIMDFAGETVVKSTHYRCKQKLMEILQNNKSLVKLFKE